MALLFAVVNSFSQQMPAIVQQIVAGGNMNDELRAMDSTADGGIVIAGTTVSANNSMITRRVANSYTDGLVMRYDATGNLLWSACYGGSRTDYINDIKQTADGGFIAVGRSYSTNYDLPAANDSLYSNIWVFKLGATGVVEWSRVFGGNAQEDAVSVLQIADGSYIVAGYTATADGIGSIPSGADLLIIKLDANGNNAVTKRYGGSRDDKPSKIIQLSNGNYVVIGTTESPNTGIVTGNHSTNLTSDIWVVWLDGNLNHIKNKCYGGPGQDYGVDVVELDSSNLVIGGNVYINSGGEVRALPHHGATEAWVARINKDQDRPNDTLWTRPYGGNKDDNLRSIAKTPDGNIIIGVQTYSNSDPVTDITDSKGGPNNTIADVWLAKIDVANAAIIARRCYGNSMGDDLNQIIVRGNSIVFGCPLPATTRDSDLVGQPAYGGMDIWIARLADSTATGARKQTAANTTTLSAANAPAVKMYLKGNSMVVNYTSSNNQAGAVQLLDIDGKLIQSYKVTLQQGTHAMELNTGPLPTATVYVGVLTAGGKKYTVKMVK